MASFSLLSYRMIMDTARRNGLSWDAVFSCEGIGKYKLLPEAYQAVAGYLQLAPEECCMVACHPFDLEAARAVGFRTAYVHRDNEWGPEQEASHWQSHDFDIVVADFAELAGVLRAD